MSHYFYLLIALLSTSSFTVLPNAIENAKERGGVLHRDTSRGGQARAGANAVESRCVFLMLSRKGGGGGDGGMMRMSSRERADTNRSSPDLFFFVVIHRPISSNTPQQDGFILWAITLDNIAMIFSL